MRRPRLRQIVYILLSNLFYALSFVLFYLDNQIAAGGFGGIAMALSYVLPLTPGLLTFAMTVPFLIWGGFQRGWLFSLETFLSSLLFSVFEDALLWLPTLTRNTLLAAVFGGACFSIGTVCMLRAGVSAGGTDLVAQLIRYHFPHVTHGTLQLAFNGLCVTAALLTFGNMEVGFYSILAICISSALTDRFTSGQDKVFIGYVITKSEPGPIAAQVGAHLHRSVTLQKGLGMYSREEQNILMIVVKPAEVYRLREIVTEIDPSAFVVFSLASGARGGGFQAEMD